MRWLDASPRRAAPKGHETFILRAASTSSHRLLQRRLLSAHTAQNAWGSCCYDKGVYVEDLSDPVIEIILEHVSRKTSPMSSLLFYRLDGAYSRAGDDETAFSGGRSPRYAAFIVGLTPDAGLLAAERGWVRGFWQALRPHAIGGADGYINSTSEYSGDGVRDSYGPAKYQRLAAIKAEYDPGNVFSLNANIPPA